MRKILVSASAAAVSLVVTAPALGYSARDEIACTPDVWRLCRNEMPDRRRITACLYDNRSNLSAACFKVFSRPEREEPAPSGAPAGRAAPNGPAAPPPSQQYRWGG